MTTVKRKTAQTRKKPCKPNFCENWEAVLTTDVVSGVFPAKWKQNLYRPTFLFAKLRNEVKGLLSTEELQGFMEIYIGGFSHWKILRVFTTNKILLKWIRRPNMSTFAIRPTLFSNTKGARLNWKWTILFQARVHFFLQHAVIGRPSR
jgi:hypothetical protein